MHVAAIKAHLPDRIIGLLRQLKWSSSISAFRSRIVTHRYVGHELRVNICDAIAEEWYDKDCPDLEETRTLIDFADLASKRMVFVLGAHQCVVALLVAQQIAAEGRVVAVEGTRFNVDVGLKNISTNGARNLTLIHSVVGARDGTAEFVSVGNGFLGRGRKERTEKVPAVSIDALAATYGDPDFVSVDIEGVEYSALATSALLRRGVTTWAVEAHGDTDTAHYGGSNRQLVALFREAGYDVFQFDRRDRYRPLVDGEPVSPSRLHLCCVPRDRASHIDVSSISARP